MKDFIKNKLRVLLEGRLATHTPSNPRGENVKVKTTEDTIENIKNEIIFATEEYKNNIEGYGGVYDGDGTYQMDLYPNGYFRGKLTSIGDKREPGTFNDPNPYKRSFFVKSCTNIQHPDQPEKSCKPVNKSPMEDAKIKVLVFFKDEILEFLRKNMEGEDEYTVDKKATELSAQKTGEEGLKSFSKYQKDKEIDKMKSDISISDEEAKLTELKLELTREKVLAARAGDLKLKRVLDMKIKYVLNRLDQLRLEKRNKPIIEI